MILRRQIAGIGVDPTSERSITEVKPNLGADRRRPRSIPDVDGHPVSTVPDHVEKKTYRCAKILDHDVLASIVVEVREDGSPTGSSGC